MPRRLLPLAAIATLAAVGAALLVPGTQALAYRLVAVGAVVAVLAGVRIHRPATARGWRTLAAGMAMFTVGDLLHLLHTSRTGETPVPSLGDPAYLLAYPLLLAGSVGIRGTHDRGRRLGLDTLIVAVGGCVLAWPAVVAPTLAAPSESSLATAVTLAYPIADLVLLAALVRLVLNRSRQTPSSLAVAAAFTCQLVGDTLYQQSFLAGADGPSALNTVVWMAGFAFAAIAALHPSMAAPAAPPPVLPDPIRTVAMGGAMLTPPFVIGVFHPEEWGALAAWAALVLLVLARQRGLVDEILRSATHDDLTGLPNRVGLEERTADALRRGPVAVAFADVDDFRTVNEALGHGGGDELLRAIAERLTASSPAGTIVARFGGDEFAVVVPGIGDRSTAARHAANVRDLLSASFRIAGFGEVVISATIGAAVGHDVSAAMLLRDADIALARSRAMGAIQVLHGGESADRQRAAERLRAASALRRAIPGGELRLHYQPEIAVADGAVIGFEALVRWQRDGVLVPPMEFVPAAEASGDIVEIGAWVIEEACAQIARWQRERPGVAVPCVSVNVSGRQLGDPAFPDTVLRAVRSSGIDPSSLCLEVTETSVVADIDRAVAALSRVKRLGVTVAVDDFGTGHSSLSQLRRLPVDWLKIDRSFVRDVDGEPDDRAIVGAIVSMAHALGLRTVAEGVETEDQLRALRELGCDFAQGYLVARPCPAAEAARFLDDRSPVSSESGR